MLLTQNIHVQYNIYSTVSSSWNKSCKYCNVYRIINTYIGTTQCYGAAPFLGRLRLRLRFLAQSIFVISLKNFINVVKSSGSGSNHHHQASQHLTGRWNSYTRVRVRSKWETCDASTYLQRWPGMWTRSTPVVKVKHLPLKSHWHIEEGLN